MEVFRYRKAPLQRVESQAHIVNMQEDIQEAELTKRAHCSQWLYIVHPKHHWMLTFLFTSIKRYFPTIILSYGYIFQWFNDITKWNYYRCL